MRYGAVEDREEEVVEMQGVTDDEQEQKKRKGKKSKSGLAPGQALSFTGLQPRSYEGVDMLDTKQLVPRILGGCFCMVFTIGCVFAMSFHILQSGEQKALDRAGNDAGSVVGIHSSAQKHQQPLHGAHVHTASHGRTAHAKLKVHQKAKKSESQSMNPTSWMESIVDGKTPSSQENSRRLLVWDESRLGK